MVPVLYRRHSWKIVWPRATRLMARPSILKSGERAAKPSQFSVLVSSAPYPHKSFSPPSPPPSPISSLFNYIVHHQSILSCSAGKVRTDSANKNRVSRLPAQLGERKRWKKTPEDRVRWPFPQLKMKAWHIANNREQKFLVNEASCSQKHRYNPATWLNAVAFRGLQEIFWWLAVSGIPTLPQPVQLRHALFHFCFSKAPGGAYW